MAKVDFGKTAEDYKRHRAGFPEAFFEHMAGRGLAQRGQRILDLGTGTGSLARGLAKRGCEVVGLDPSEELLEAARSIDEKEDVRVDYVVATAERTRLPSHSFDVIYAGQSWHWFKQAQAIREVARLLKPDASLVVAHFDWLPMPGNVVEATEALINQYNADWKMGGGTGLHPQWLAEIRAAHFREISTMSFDVEVSYSHQDWCGRIRASAGIQASLPPDMVARFDEKLHRALQEQFPQQPLSVPHCVWALFARAPS